MRIHEFEHRCVILPVECVTKMEWGVRAFKN